MLDKETLQWDDNIFILKEIIDARQIRLSTNSSNIQYKEEDGRIVYLNIADRLELRKDDRIEVRINKVIHHYNINIITKLGNSFLIKNNNLTKATSFILPILNYNKEHFCTDTYLENVYLNKELNQLCLVYRFIKGEIYNKLETFLLNHELFIKSIDIDTQHVMYIFKIPVTQKSTIDKFVKGNYSGFTDKYKQSIIRFYGYKYGGRMYNILTKEPEYKRQLEISLNCTIPDNIDLHDIPEMSEEVIEI